LFFVFNEVELHNQIPNGCFNAIKEIYLSSPWMKLPGHFDLIRHFVSYASNSGKCL